MLRNYFCASNVTRERVSGNAECSTSELSLLSWRDFYVMPSSLPALLQSPERHENMATANHVVFRDPVVPYWPSWVVAVGVEIRITWILAPPWSLAWVCFRDGSTLAPSIFLGCHFFLLWTIYLPVSRREKCAFDRFSKSPSAFAISSLEHDEKGKGWFERTMPPELSINASTSTWTRTYAKA